MKILDRIKKNALLKSGAKYSIASTISSVVGMIVGIVNMRWLGPEVLGIWQSVTIINSYLPFLQLGIQSTLAVDLPVLLGKKEEDNAFNYIRTTRAFANFLAILISVVSIVALIVMLYRHTDTKILVGVMAVLYIAVLSCFNLHFIATYRSANAFDKLSKIYVVDAVVSLGLIYFIYRFNYYGLVMYQVVKDSIRVFLMYYYAPYRKIGYRFDKKLFVSIFKRGLLIMGINQIHGVRGSIPRLILLSLGGVKTVGLFSPALAVHSLMYMIPNQIMQFLQPQLGYKYGQTKKASSLLHYIDKITLYIPLMTIPVVIVLWFAMGPVLTYIFPKYLESLLAIRIMMVGFIFACSHITRNVLFSIRAYPYLYLLYSLDVVMDFGIPFLFIKLSGFSILTSVSIGLAIASFLMYSLNYFVIRHVIKLDKYNEG